MKQKLFLVLSALFLAACSTPASQPENDGASAPAQETTGGEAGSWSDHSILIAYFTMPEDTGTDTSSSASRVAADGEVLGNTEYIARLIQQESGGDLFAIETQQTYPDDHDALTDLAYEEQAEAARPALRQTADVEGYDIIFLGFPNWWGDLPMPLYTFLEETDLSGKTIIPFVTHGGNGFSATVDTIASLQPQASVSDQGLSISRNDVSDAQGTVSEWMSGLEASL